MDGSKRILLENAGALVELKPVTVPMNAEVETAHMLIHCASRDPFGMVGRKVTVRCGGIVRSGEIVDVEETNEGCMVRILSDDCPAFKWDDLES